MKKSLRPGLRLLLILAFLGDLFEDLADAGGLMSFSYQQVYGYVPQKYKKHNFSSLVSRYLKIGNIEKEIKNGQAFLKLSSLGEEKIINKIPIFKFRKKSWDGKWLMVIFDIPEKNSKVRKALREKLRELGFAMLQRSVWISPYDLSSLLKEFLENIGLSGTVLVVGPTKILIEDEKTLASAIFSLERINREYQKLVDKWNNREGEDKEDLAKEIKSRYFEILATDPLLPEQLLPKEWWGRKAMKLVRKWIKE